MLLSDIQSGRSHISAVPEPDLEAAVGMHELPAVMCLFLDCGRNLD